MMHPQPLTTCAAFAAALLLSIPAAVDADEERATEVLDAMVEHYATLEDLSYEIRMYSLQRMGPQQEEVDMRLSVKLEKPNRLSLDVRNALEDEEPGMQVRSDGEQLHTYDVANNRYTTQDAPETFEGYTRSQTLLEATQGMIELAVSPMTDDPIDELLEQASAVRHAGQREYEDENHDIVRLDTEQQVAFELYVTTGDEPRLRQVVIDFEEAIAMAQQFGQEVQAEAHFRLQQWQANAGIDEQEFSFTPPEDAEAVATLHEQPPHPILETEADNFQLERVGGGERQLSDHLGEDIVILDFWATWCAPCIDAMPLLIDVAERYQDRNVVFYAVNVREEPDTINAFMQEHDLEIEHVLLDRDGRVAQSYAVEGIPQTVVIGKDGVVHSVHVGFSPELDHLLASDIDELLDD